MKSFVSLFVSLLLSVLGLAWFSQNSINAYWQQTYHQSSYLERLSGFSVWNSGGILQAKAYQLVDDWKAYLEEENGKLVETVSVAEQSASPIAGTQVQNTEKAAPVQAESLKISLKKGDKVFFAGDSLMQGVAPHVQKWLKQQYGIESLNLSKQSTGLSYPSFFDWPLTIEKTLKQNPEIRVLAVFLGPNDPWDFPNPKGGKYLKFQTPEWEAVYQERVERILRAAEAGQVKVIWLGIPFMKKVKLNEQMRYLDQLLHRLTDKRVLWLPTDILLSNGEQQYSDSASINGKVVRYRSKDGIHFSTEGQKLLADQIMKQLAFPSVNSENELKGK